MNKLVYLLWDARPMAPAQRRVALLEQCAPALLALNPHGLVLFVADEFADMPSPSPRFPVGTPPFVAQVNLWLEDLAGRTGYEALLRGAGFEIAGYRVDEWLYSDYGDNPHARRRDWPDGQRSPGIQYTTLLQKPGNLSREEWMRRWFGWQSPMSEWMQPRTRYVRNVVEEALTPGAMVLDGIVEEDWPSKQHVLDKKLFFGADSAFGVIRNILTMVNSVRRILRWWNIYSVVQSEYFLRTPRPARHDT